MLGPIQGHLGYLGGGEVGFVIGWVTGTKLDEWTQAWWLGPYGYEEHEGF